MKKLIFVISVVTCTSSMGATLNLNGGDVIQIQPNVVTTVSCGANANDSGGICSKDEVGAALSAVQGCIKSPSPTVPCIHSYLIDNPIVGCNTFRSNCFALCNATSVASDQCMTVCRGN